MDFATIRGIFREIVFIEEDKRALGGIDIAPAFMKRAAVPAALPAKLMGVVDSLLLI